MFRSLSLTGMSLFFAAADALAQTGVEPQQPQMGEILSRMLPMFVVVFLIFYFMIMKPQQEKLKSQQSMLSSLKAGDNIVTSGGILGRVIKAEADFVLIEVANNVRIKVEPAHIGKKIQKEKEEKSKS